MAPREFLLQWLDYHEFVAHSSVATIDRYRAAVFTRAGVRSLRLPQPRRGRGLRVEGFTSNRIGHGGRIPAPF